MSNAFIYPNLPQVLLALRPNARWSLIGYEYSGLEWLDEVQTKPTEQEVDTEFNKQLAEYEANQYQRDRAAAYPSVEDQLDTLYHGGYEGWFAQIQTIKNQFPKP